jgi:hypothetical protein
LKPRYKPLFDRALPMVFDSWHDWRCPFLLDDGARRQKVSRRS